MTHYDVIVLGGGTMGTAAAWELGKRGLSGLVLEQFQHVHTNGAHSGQTRVIRHAYAEGPDYVPLVFRADDLWMDLEAASGKKVFHRVGALELSAPGNDHAHLARAAAEAHAIPFEWLPMDEVRQRFPQFKVEDDWVGGFGDRGGFLDVDTSLHAMATHSRLAGIEIRENTPVSGFDVSDSGVRVQFEGGDATADRLIVTAGAWSSRLLADVGMPLQVLRKTLFWLEVEDPESYGADRMPCYIAGIPGYEFYGFPGWGEPGIKCAVHSGGDPASPDNVDRNVSAEEEAEIVEVAGRVLKGLTGKVLRSATCLYTVTPDHNFIVDRMPGQSRVTIGAGFSGHGFKFTPAIGEMLVQIAFDERETLPLFGVNRFVAV
jgi:monomeric sarcosine oxidase